MCDRAFLDTEQHGCAVGFTPEALFLPVEDGVDGGFVELVLLSPFPDGNTDGC